MTSSLIMMFLEYSFNGPSKHLSEALIEGVWMTQTKCAWWRNLISFGSIFKAINLLSWNWLQNEHCAFCRTLIIVCQKAITFEMWFPITFATKIANFYFFCRSNTFTSKITMLSKSGVSIKTCVSSCGTITAFSSK